MKLKSSKKKSAEGFRTNRKSLILFELWYRVITSLIIVPILRFLFKITLRTAGISYLGNDTIRTYLTSPMTYVGGLIMLVILTFTTLVEVFGVITGIHESRKKIPMRMSQILRAGVDNALRVLRGRNIGIAVFVLFLLPFTNLIPLAGIVSTIHIPGFIMDAIWANTTYSLLFASVSLIILFITLKRIFMLHAFVLRREDASAAHKTGLRLIRRRMIRTYLKLLLHAIKIALIFIAIVAGVSAIALILIRFGEAAEMRHYIALEVVNSIVLIAASILSLISPVLGSIAVGECYYHNCEAEGIDAAVISDEYPRMSRGACAALGGIAVVLFGVTVITTVSTTPMDFADRSDINNWSIMRIGVAAHRGYSTDNPENSMPAFRAAIDVHADQIELDVHQTKDGVVVVTHDADINRIAGVNKYVYDLTLEELRSYDVGSWFSPKFKDLRVATLDDVLKLCKDKIFIQIEIKPTGHEPDFEKHVAEIVHANNFENECVLASMDAACLKRVRQVAPELQTLYIMSAAAGNLNAADFADGFSVEETSITPELVNSIHQMGKPCYVWTINDPDSVPYLIDSGVDAILTDDPVMIRKALICEGKSELLVGIIDLIYNEDSYSGLFDEKATQD